MYAFSAELSTPNVGVHQHNYSNPLWILYFTDVSYPSNDIHIISITSNLTKINNLYICIFNSSENADPSLVIHKVNALLEVVI